MKISSRLPSDLSLEHYGKDSFFRLIEVTDSAGNLYDFTNHIAFCHLKESNDSTSELFNFDLTITTGYILIQKSNTIMEGLEAGNYFWELAFSISGIYTTWASGDFVKVNLPGKSYPSINLQTTTSPAVKMVVESGAVLSITIQNTEASPINYEIKRNVDLIGTKNGVNTLFAIDAVTIITGSEAIYLGSTRLKRGEHYYITGTAVTMVTWIPGANDPLFSDHQEVIVPDGGPVITKTPKSNVPLFGVTNGVNDTFTIDASAIEEQSEAIYLDSTRLVRDTHYTITGLVVTLTTWIPAANQKVFSDHIEIQ